MVNRAETADVSVTGHTLVWTAHTAILDSSSKIPIPALFSGLSTA
jgi:hypothetical protein